MVESAKARLGGIDMGPLASQTGYLLRRAQMAVFEDFHTRFAAEDIRPAQYSVLKLLALNPGARQTEVSAALGIQRSNFAPLFEGLAARGLVERRRSETDRRSLGLFLTAEGAATMARLDALVLAHEAKFADRIGEQGKASLRKLLFQLISE